MPYGQYENTSFNGQTFTLGNVGLTGATGPDLVSSDPSKPVRVNGVIPGAGGGGGGDVFLSNNNTYDVGIVNTFRGNTVMTTLGASDKITCVALDAGNGKIETLADVECQGLNAGAVKIETTDNVECADVIASANVQCVDVVASGDVSCVDFGATTITTSGDVNTGLGNIISGGTITGASISTNSGGSITSAGDVVATSGTGNIHGKSILSDTNISCGAGGNYFVGASQIASSNLSDVSALLNTSATAQTKAGALTLSGNLTTNGGIANINGISSTGGFTTDVMTCQGLLTTSSLTSNGQIEVGTTGTPLILFGASAGTQSEIREATGANNNLQINTRATTDAVTVKLGTASAQDSFGFRSNGTATDGTTNFTNVRRITIQQPLNSSSIPNEYQVLTNSPEDQYTQLQSITQLLTQSVNLGTDATVGNNTVITVGNDVNDDLIINAETTFNESSAVATTKDIISPDLLSGTQGLITTANQTINRSLTAWQPTITNLVPISGYNNAITNLFVCSFARVQFGTNWYINFRGGIQPNGAGATFPSGNLTIANMGATYAPAQNMYFGYQLQPGVPGGFMNLTPTGDFILIGLSGTETQIYFGGVSYFVD